MLLNRPKILVLDEANNGLDQDGDRHLIELLIHLKGRVTVLLITQRPSLLDIADRKLELISGKLMSIQKPGGPELGPQSIASPTPSASRSRK